MGKVRGFWTPLVWGWLPDKSETSYTIYILLVKKKLEELGLELNVASVLCDFELNILKSVDSMIGCEIFGCSFHQRKCLQRKVDKSGFKTIYENDQHFYEFINHCGALAHLPIEDLEMGLKLIQDKFHFQDERTAKFKIDFLQYINDFWINGCIPPKVWNLFGRSTDLTNNNQVFIL